MTKKIVPAIAFLALLAPFTAFAFNFPSFPEGGNIPITTIIENILGFVWPLFVAFAILMFITAGVMFLTARGDSGKLLTARNAVIWGLAGIVVAILAFSMVAIIGNVVIGGSGVGH